MKNFETTKRREEANAITHGGIFHADDVMATVILSKVFCNLKVLRTNSVPTKTTDDIIIYDIGEGAFDHHQKGGNGARKNGVPYAACGLLWKKYGREICKNTSDPDAVWCQIDRELIQGIDAQDNGVLPELDYPCNPMSISNIIRQCNPTWDYTGDTDKLFEDTVFFAERIFDKSFAKAAASAKGKVLVEEAVNNSNGPVLVLDQYLPWVEFITKIPTKRAHEILFVVFPSLRGGWNWQCVPGKHGRFSNRKNVPDSWKGLRDAAYREATGVETAIFCHPAGFIGGAETREDAIKLAYIAAES